MKEKLNYKNQKWMEYFQENRTLWSPIHSERERLSEQYIKEQLCQNTQ